MQAAKVWEAIAQHGSIRKAAAALGINESTARKRIGRMGKGGGNTGQPITVPTTVSRANGRVDLDIQNGKVIVFSDAHFEPKIKTTAFRALLAMIKQVRPVAVICNGDAFDGGTISRWPRIGWDNKPTVKEELEAVDAALTEIEEAAKGAQLIWPLGNHDCLDAETELLTRRGWVKHNDIKIDDEILSIDGEKAVWTGINYIIAYPYQGELVRIEKLRMSMAVTPNHRVLLNRLSWRDKDYTIREFRRANDLPSSFNIPTAAQIDSNGVDLPDDAIALCGWILTDGGINGSSVSIYQSKPEGRAEIERVLDSLGLKYSVYERQRGMRAVCGRELLVQPMVSAHYMICAEDSRKVLRWLPKKGALPEWAHDLDGRQFQILLDAIVAGDGVWDGQHPEKKTCCVIYGQEPILSSIQSVAVTHGWRARLAIDNRGDFRLCLTKEPKIRVERPQVFSEHYEGVVWCLQVPHENFMVRRNGCAYFTGNCRFETYLAANAPQYQGVSGFSLKDRFPKWRPCWTCWINDETCVTHFYHTGMHAVWNNIIKGQVNYISSHRHSPEVRAYTNARGKTLYGVDTGTLADAMGAHNVDYQQGRHGNHRSAFALLTYRDGQLLMPELIQKWDENTVQFRGHLLCADTLEVI